MFRISVSILLMNFKTFQMEKVYIERICRKNILVCLFPTENLRFNILENFSKFLFFHGFGTVFRTCDLAWVNLCSAEKNLNLKYDFLLAATLELPRFFLEATETILKLLRDSHTEISRIHLWFSSQLEN